MLISEFDFQLSEELIATRPLSQRDASRMLVVNAPIHGKKDTGDLFQDKYIFDFISYIKPGDVVVFNNSRVIPARFTATDKDGTGYEITLHTNHSDKTWWGLCKKFNKIDIGDELILADDTRINIISKDDESGLLLKFDCDNEFALLEKIGKMPLPPYMKRDDDADDRERYQTVYAASPGSMAAPTAGLHFTRELIAAIKNAGAAVVNVTLHVGAGTWAPVKSNDITNHKMHKEWGTITPGQADIINHARANGKKIIAVGTTSMRLLESAADNSRDVKSFCGTTDIFITPGYDFRVVDILLTNFHLPKSTLFILVSAFAGLPEMHAAYSHAIAKKYRFFSYGDCCLLFRKNLEFVI
ncbi:MAG: tRNA preQ1(34) S-adenosylmethionine ribosyltransferase-isomerase QueA [Alphaproteobacteria bacterium]|nr:tRNA preQ1(34) S-adenosylmethionine ribosyltransferase-isomerase QueA [Alphaproteobacteria bacterium]